MLTLKVRVILQWLHEDGWFLDRQPGTSHRQFRHPAKPGIVTVNGKKSDDLFGGLLDSIAKQAGWTKDDVRTRQ